MAHFAVPFSLPITGARVDEQDSPAEIEACVNNIVACPQGFRTDLPDFGLPDIQFDTVPLDVAAIKQAVGRYEPRAELTVTAAGGSDQTVTIRVQA